MNAALYFERVGVSGPQCKPVGIFVLTEDGRTRQEAEALLHAKFDGPEGPVHVERVIIADHQMAESIGPITDKIGPVYWENTLAQVLERLNLTIVPTVTS